MHYFRRLTLLTIAYYIAGCLGSLLAIPPGQATAIWPASGIALAGLLVWGPRYVVSSDPVTAKSFTDFTTTFIERSSAIQSLSWNKLVHKEDREAYEQSIRREGFPNFATKTRPTLGQIDQAPVWPYQLPVTYLARFSGNERVHGYDVYGHGAVINNIRRRAIDRGRDEGRAIASGRIPLLQAEGSYGLLVYRPVYALGSNTRTVDERNPAFIGNSAGVFIIPDMIEGVANLASRAQMDLTLHDIPTDTPTLLYDSRTPDHKASPEASAVSAQALTSSERFEFAGSEWQILFIESEAARSGRHNWALWAVLAGGLLFTGMAGSGLSVITARTEIVKRLVDERTEELQQAIVLAEEAIQAKSEFLTHVSHELRTPMNAIVGMTVLTLDSDITSAQRGNLQAVKESARALVYILNDISRPVSSRGG